MFWASVMAAHKSANLRDRSKKHRHKPIEFRENRMNLELRHQIFVECSGMHRRKVYNLVRYTCERGEHPRSLGCCMSDVLSTTWTMCALTTGPSYYFESVLRTLGELAIYAALFLSVVLASSTAPPMIPDGYSRDLYVFGQFGSYACLGTVIFLHIALHLQSNSYIRNSDKLYCIGKHLWKVFFLSFICLVGGVVFSVVSAAACVTSLISGDSCLDGSITYSEYNLQNISSDRMLLGNKCASDPLKYQVFAFVALGFALVLMLTTCMCGCTGNIGSVWWFGNIEDPCDLELTWQRYLFTAHVGRRFAQRDLNHDGFIDFQDAIADELKSFDFLPKKYKKKQKAANKVYPKNTQVASEKREEPESSTKAQATEDTSTHVNEVKQVLTKNLEANNRKINLQEFLKIVSCSDFLQNFKEAKLELKQLLMCPDSRATLGILDDTVEIPGKRLRIFNGLQLLKRDSRKAAFEKLWKKKYGNDENEHPAASSESSDDESEEIFTESEGPQSLAEKKIMHSWSAVTRKRSSGNWAIAMRR